MSLAAQRRARVAGAVDRQWGEPVLLTPRTESQYKGASPDPIRQPILVQGRFTLRPEIADDKGQRHGYGRLEGVARLAGAQTSVVIGAAQAALIPWPVRTGDLATLTDRGVSYAVAVCQPTNGGLILMLTVERTA
jgi:hypothetical protein